MYLNFTESVRAEEYVSPSLEVTTVNTEKGFCASMYHDGFYHFTEIE